MITPSGLSRAVDPSQLIGSPWVTWIAAGVTVAYCAGLGWMTYSIYHVTPELIQVRLLRDLRALQNSVLSMGLGLMVWMMLTTLFIADITLPDPVWIVGGGVSAGLLALGMYQYSGVMSVPRSPAV